MDLKTSLTNLAGIGPILAKRLNSLELFTIEDLINHFPFRYDDFSQNQNVANTRTDEVVTLRGELWSIKNTYTRFRKVLTQAILNDSTGTIDIIWFNQPWLIKNLKAGDSIQVSGKISRKGNKTILVSPVWEKINLSSHIQSEGSNIHTGRLIPVYPETYGITSKWLRFKLSKILPNILPQVIDPLPDFVQKKFFPLRKALEQIHFPDDFEQAELARQKLAFDELFYIQLNSQKQKIDWSEKKIVKALNVGQKKLKAFIKNLPFNLTPAQERVLQEMIADLKKVHPMNRLIQGEVGSGKTVIAAIAAYLIYLNNLKSIIMAPTEILAFQHFETLSKLLDPFGVEVGIYTGSRKSLESRDKNQVKQSSKLSTLATNHYPDIIIGTHALLSEKLILENVGLVVVDEQQRFGVEQRTLIRNKANTPHFLTMTATPIPRTVALTLYGDLDISIIDELPLGRKIVRTHFVPQKKRVDAYEFIKKQIQAGHQVYVITPLIEWSETLVTAKAAKVEFEKLKNDIFPNFSLGLLHGKLKSKEKEEVINSFKNHEIDILVSTSVVEVGVDIPNATVMVIEGAERFGLAQLHQLRGRVGRGSAQSYAFLFTEDENPAIISRIRNLEKIFDGLKLSELDLKIRGSGEIFGKKQSGRWDLKIANLSDLHLIEEAKEAVAKILSDSPRLDKYPELKRKLSNLTIEVMPD